LIIKEKTECRILLPKEKTRAEAEFKTENERLTEEKLALEVK
jgi:hypothetical protein